ncbi:MFS transporter [Vulcanisaeta thermophila]|uniref:MFS transporter n=1 Tax=Vulcanisaeta thermophila TaxID=867917 RepID=UPI000853B63D|nr:MFS transporter [Vulcanisaeta thermophila]
MNSGRYVLIQQAITLFLLTLAVRATNNMINTTVPLLAKYVLSFNNTLVGALVAVIFIANFISVTYLNARLEARIRRRIFIVANGIVPLLLLLYFLGNPVITWVAAVITGVAYGFIMPNILTAAGIAGDQLTAERFLALYALALSTSLIIGPSIESYLLSFVSYRLVFLFFIPMALVSFALSWRVPFPSNEARSRDSVVSDGIFRNRGFLSAVLAITGYNVPFIAFTAFIAIYAMDVFHVNKALAYSVFIPFFTTSFITRLFMTIRPLKYLFMPMLASLVMTAVGLLLMFMAPSYLVFLLAMALLGIPHGSVFTMSTIIISRNVELGLRNRANSYFSAYMSILSIVVPPLFGFMSDVVGIRLAMFLLIIPVIVMTALFTHVYRGVEGPILNFKFMR